MRTALDAPTASLDEHEAGFCSTIRQHGWVRTEIASDEKGPGFTYTTGFWLTEGGPEIIAFSLPSEVAHAVLWDLFREFEYGRKLPTATPLTDVLGGNVPVYFFPVDRAMYGDVMGWSRWFYGGDDFPCHQMVWPDSAGRFPWEQDFDPNLEGSQPDLSKGGWHDQLGIARRTDFAAVTSREEAWRWVNRGDLVQMPMFPALFGGDETDERNVLYVPPPIAAQKRRVDEEKVLPLVQGGEPVEYNVEPKYAGALHVPTMIVVTVSGSRQFQQIIKVWDGP